MTRGQRRAFVVVTAVTAVILVVMLTTSLVAFRSNPTEALPRSLRIAVIGDDFSAGNMNRVVWPTLMARRTGWAVSNLALPDTGYRADGNGGQAFTYQVDRALAAQPDVILMVGGLKDTSFPDMREVGDGAINAMQKVVLGAGRTLVIGPTWYETPVPSEVTNVSNAIRGAATAAGVPYLGALDPPWLTPRLMRSDLAYPSDEGQSLLADRIADQVRTWIVR